ncbi:hypothetical protein BJ741DRAFT_617437 [Chytriomyces cf. hyalinus JEL632]|nr:hypothetical protein BJ741DRAFT_617437 [Chytriomyces cf. hyalinus JEL632]
MESISCPHPLLPKSLRNDSEDPNAIPNQFCNGPCCIPCPAFYNLYPDVQISICVHLNLFLHGASTLGSVFVILSILLFKKLQVHPQWIVLYFSLSSFIFHLMNLFALKDPMKHYCEDAVTSASSSNMNCVLKAAIHFYLLYVMLLWIAVYLVNLHLKIIWHINFFVDKYVYLQIVWVLPVAMLLPVAFDKKSQFISVGKECYPRGPLMDPLVWYPFIVIVAVTVAIHLSTVVSLFNVWWTTPAPESVALKKDVVRKGFSLAKRTHTPTFESSQTGKVQDVEDHRRHQRVDFITQLKENWRTLVLSLTFSLVTLFSLTYFFQFYQLSGGISAKQPWIQEWYSCLLLNNGREACQYIATREAPNLAMYCISNCLLASVGICLWFVVGTGMLQHWSELIRSRS